MVDEGRGAIHRDRDNAAAARGGPLKRPALPAGATLAGLLQQLDKTQWLSAEDLRARQTEQLGRLVHQAARHSPHFGDRLARAGLKPDDVATPEGLRRLPVLTRRDIQAAGKSFYCATLPAIICRCTKRAPPARPENRW